MGILVPEALLPNGITVSNVYMSFASEVVYFHPRNMDGSYQITSQYRVYKDSTKNPESDIKFPVSVTVTSISNNSVHDLLYNQLKTFYNGYTDSIDNVIASTGPSAYPASGDS
jgi:hypothetical protein